MSFNTLRLTEEQDKQLNEMLEKKFTGRKHIITGTELRVIKQLVGAKSPDEIAKNAADPKVLKAVTDFLRDTQTKG